MKTLIIITAAMIVTSGCGGGGGGPVSEPTPAAIPEPTDIWEGNATNADGFETGIDCVISHGAELFCVNDEGQVLFGSAALNDDGIKRKHIVEGKNVGEGQDVFEGKNSIERKYTVEGKYTWADPLGQAQAGVLRGEGRVECDYAPHESLECKLTGADEDGTASSCTLMLYHKDAVYDPATGHACYLRDYVVPEQLAGAWMSRVDGVSMLSIDTAGRVFSQGTDNGCVMNGKARLIWDDRENPLNLFRVELDIDACTDPALTVYNGKTLRGLAYLDETQTEKDTLVVAVRVKGPDGYEAIGRRYRRQ